MSETPRPSRAKSRSPDTFNIVGSIEPGTIEFEGDWVRHATLKRFGGCLPRVATESGIPPYASVCPVLRVGWPRGMGL